MTDTIGAGSPRRPATAQGAAQGGGCVHEAYSFACMNCGHGWEQAYEIERHVDTTGRPFVIYLADGVRVPSPLTRPTCQNCDGHQVRIMRPGRVAGVAAARPAARRVPPAGSAGGGARLRSVLKFLRRGARGRQT